MAIVTVIEAARLTGKSTQTLYRHIKAGKLSRRTDNKLDTAELLRVYGEFKATETPLHHQIDTPMLSHETSKEAWLMAQIESLQADIRELRAESLEREKRLMALIEHRQAGLFSKLFK
jgi:predicted transcriptional regulator